MRAGVERRKGEPIERPGSRVGREFQDEPLTSPLSKDFLVTQARGVGPQPLMPLSLQCCWQA